MNKTSLSLAAVGLLMSAGAVSAATVEDSFEVSATVVASCAIDTTGPLSFGDYDPVSGLAVDGTTTVGVRCTNGHPYQIGLGVGANADAGARRLVNGDDAAAFLGYELYSGSAGGTVWGDALGTTTVTGSGDGTEEIRTIHGRIAADQWEVKIGAYTDTVAIVVTY